MATLDVPSFVAVQFGGSGDWTPMPALPGTSATRDPALQKILLAGNGSVDSVTTYESLNFVRGLSMPMVDFQSIPHSSWFTAAHLQAMFTAKTYGLLASLGKLGFRIGDGNAGDEVEGYFTACYVPMMQILAQGSGTPLMVRFMLMAAGTETTLGTVTDVPVGNTGLFMSDGATFNGGLTEVEAWSLTLINSLRPDTACPPAGIVANGSPIFPKGYVNGPIGVALQVTQKAGATHIDDASLQTANQVSITLNSTVASGSPAQITFDFQGLKPAKNAAITGDVSLISRSYVGQANASFPSIAIA